MTERALQPLEDFRRALRALVDMATPVAIPPASVIVELRRLAAELEHGAADEPTSTDNIVSWKPPRRPRWREPMPIDLPGEEVWRNLPDRAAAWRHGRTERMSIDRGDDDGRMSIPDDELPPGRHGGGQ
jgi:hypothetical protein